MKPSTTLRFMATATALLSLFAVSYAQAANHSSNYRGEDRYRAFEVQGKVTEVSTKHNEVVVVRGTERYVASVDSKTRIIFRSRSGHISDIRVGDQARLTGTLGARARVYADSIEVMGAQGWGWGHDNDRDRDRDRDRYNDERSDRNRHNDNYRETFDGTVVRTTSRFSRMLTIRTRTGEVTVDVPKDITILRNGRKISVHDLNVGDDVTVSGRWHSDTLTADRIEASGYHKR
ncbi:MAG: DUF5666 domain-containing protein [Armatimonadota bacterium]|nr:DUF4131 domain-containing protein [bacterium]